MKPSAPGWPDSNAQAHVCLSTKLVTCLFYREGGGEEKRGRKRRGEEIKGEE